jgi:uncharacterized protein YlxW (UPF0749 family)
MLTAKVSPVQISLLILSGLLAGNSLAQEPPPSLTTQRMELEAKTQAIKDSTARDRRRLKELKKLIDELSTNNQTLDKQLQDTFQELKKAVETTGKKPVSEPR